MTKAIQTVVYIYTHTALHVHIRTCVSFVHLHKYPIDFHRFFTLIVRHKSKLFILFLAIFIYLFFHLFFFFVFWIFVYRFHHFYNFWNLYLLYFFIFVFFVNGFLNSALFRLIVVFCSEEKMYNDKKISAKHMRVYIYLCMYATFFLPSCKFGFIYNNHKFYDGVRWH